MAVIQSNPEQSKHLETARMKVKAGSHRPHHTHHHNNSPELAPAAQFLAEALDLHVRMRRRLKVMPASPCKIPALPQGIMPLHAQSAMHLALVGSPPTACTLANTAVNIFAITIAITGRR